MDVRSFSKHSNSGSSSKPLSPEFLCRIPSYAKDLTQLKKNGDNFSLWERELKVMINKISGSSDYILHDLHKHDPKLNRAILNLIFWSIDKELQHDLDIDGSAGDAFQVLASRFQSGRSPQYLMNCTDLPAEILDSIVDIVYLYSTKEMSSMRIRKHEHHQLQISEKDKTRRDPPPLTTFQSLAVVNRRFHRLCLSRLWQNLQFPTSLPAPMSLWTEGILLKHGRLVKSLLFMLEDMSLINDGRFSENERSDYDNTMPCDRCEGLLPTWRFGIGLVNIKKIFTACPRLDSVVIDIPGSSYVQDLSSPFTLRLNGLFGLIPQIQHLSVRGIGSRGFPGEFVIGLLKKMPSLLSLEARYFKFDQKPSTEESLGRNLAQHKNLRILRLEYVTCDYETWTSNSWCQRLTDLDIDRCIGMTPGMVHTLLSGSAPILDRLRITFLPGEDPDVNGQIDLPALKQLILCHNTSFEFFLSFKGCANLEMIAYPCDIIDDQWDLVKHLLSTRTWPKLLVLDLRTYRRPGIVDFHSRGLRKQDVDNIWNSFKIKVLIPEI